MHQDEAQNRELASLKANDPSYGIAVLALG